MGGCSSVTEHSSTQAGPILVLTLHKHREGEWVTKLIDALEAYGAQAVLHDVEALTGDDIPADHAPVCWSLVVNRVSDCAALEQLKCTVMALQRVELAGVRTINGSGSYGKSSSKVLHHALLQAVGASVPRSFWLQIPTHCTDGDKAVLLADAARKLGCLPVLLKPNAGGFGSGISKFETVEELEEHYRTGKAEDSNDGIVMLQEWLAPKNGVYYRVWLLGGEVQCAVQVQSNGGYNQCMAGACTAVSGISVWAWEPPDAVKEATVRVMALMGGDMGSVELLFDTNGDAVYFDVNLCTTLPNESALDPDGLWLVDGKRRDFYAEVASYILGL